MDNIICQESWRLYLFSFLRKNEFLIIRKVLNKKLIYYSVLESSRHRLLDSGIKNRVYY